MAGMESQITIDVGYCYFLTIIHISCFSSFHSQYYRSLQLLQMQKSAPFCPIKYRFYCISTDLPWQMNNTFIIVLFLLNLPGTPCFARFSGVMIKCSEITDCGKSEQNPASCYYLLVVKLVVKGNFLLLRIIH